MRILISIKLLLILFLIGCSQNEKIEDEISAHKNLEKQKIENIKKLENFNKTHKISKRSDDIPLKKVFFNITKGNEDVIKKYIQSGLDFNRKTRKGITPLHIAASKSTPNIIKLLLKGGANPNNINNFGLKPIAYAKSKEIYEVLKSVTEIEGNDPNIAKATCFLFAWKGLDSNYTKSCVLIGDYYVNKKIYQHAGWFYLIGKELDKSIESNLNFLKQNEKSIKSALTLAHAYTLKGNYKKAKDLYGYFYIKGKNTTFKIKQNYTMLHEIYKDKTEQLIKGKKIWKELSGNVI